MLPFIHFNSAPEIQLSGYENPRTPSLFLTPSTFEETMLKGDKRQLRLAKSSKLKHLTKTEQAANASFPRRPESTQNMATPRVTIARSSNRRNHGSLGAP